MDAIDKIEERLIFLNNINIMVKCILNRIKLCFNDVNILEMVGEYIENQLAIQLFKFGSIKNAITYIRNVIIMQYSLIETKFIDGPFDDFIKFYEMRILLRSFIVKLNSLIFDDISIYKIKRFSKKYHLKCLIIRDFKICIYNLHCSEKILMFSSHSNMLDSSKFKFTNKISNYSVSFINKLDLFLHKNDCWDISTELIESTVKLLEGFTDNFIDSYLNCLVYEINSYENNYLFHKKNTSNHILNDPKVNYEIKYNNLFHIPIVNEIDLNYTTSIYDFTFPDNIQEMFNDINNQYESDINNTNISRDLIESIKCVSLIKNKNTQHLNRINFTFFGIKHISSIIALFNEKIFNIYADLNGTNTKEDYLLIILT